VTVLSGADRDGALPHRPEGEERLVGGPGDLDGDGRGDLVIGSPNVLAAAAGSGCVTAISLAPPVHRDADAHAADDRGGGDNRSRTVTGSGFGPTWAR
jgi:hypothetical protein